MWRVDRVRLFLFRFVGSLIPIIPFVHRWSAVCFEIRGSSCCFIWCCLWLVVLYDVSTVQIVCSCGGWRCAASLGFIVARDARGPLASGNSACGCLRRSRLFRPVVAALRLSGFIIAGKLSLVPYLPRSRVVGVLAAPWASTTALLCAPFVCSLRVVGACGWCWSLWLALGLRCLCFRGLPTF